MRRFVCVLFVLSLSSIAHAETEEDDPADDPRPIRYASVELNPLAAGVGHYGGQAQVALMGPLTFVVGGGRIEGADVGGWALEVGSRLYFGLSPRRADGARVVHVLLAAAYLADELGAGGAQGERRGVALDVGVSARLGRGFYVLGGVGVAHRATDLVIEDRFERMTTTPRLLLALGWGI